MHFCNTASAFVLFKAITEASKVKNGHYHGSNCCGKAREGRVDTISQPRLKSKLAFFQLPWFSFITTSLSVLVYLHLSSSVRHLITRERIEVPHSASSCHGLPLWTCKRVAAREMQTDSRETANRAEGKAMMCIKTGRNNKSWDWQPDEKGEKKKIESEREGGQSEKWANREPSLQRLLEFGQQPVPPSIALREMEREERKGWV